PFALLCGAQVWCARDKSPLGPVEGPAVCPQHEVPWASLANSPWPMFRHDPQFSGRSPYVGPRRGRIRWRFRPGERGELYPAVVVGRDSTLYFGYRELLPAGEGTFLYALNPDGTLRWKCRLGGEIGYEPGPPFVTADGKILVQSYQRQELYVISERGGIERILHLPFRSMINIGLDGSLYFVGTDARLYAATQGGILQWCSEIAGGFHWTGATISPDGAFLYVLTRREPPGGDVGGLCALAAGGSIRWHHPLPGGHSFIAPLVSYDGKVYVGTDAPGDSSGFYCIGPDGKRSSFYSSLAAGLNEPTIDKSGRVLFEAYRGLVCQDCGGNVVWEFPLAPPGGYAGPICDSEGVFYVFTEEVIALSADGKLMWRIPLEGSFTRIAAPAIGSDGVLYLGTYGEPSLLYAIE
ncbi:MAG: hypothetical protein ONB17_11945, partial [candidate division KSB1 bacterium]|nr:hypothetical protein [candidate division KSB1 bacterium]